MLYLQFLPVMLSLALIAAHFSRHGNMPLMALALALMALLAVPRMWAARVLQIALLLAGAEWMRTLIVLQQTRAAYGQPASRMILILTAVALLTVASALLLTTKRARARIVSSPLLQENHAHGLPVGSSAEDGNVDA